jgi:RimJ/RimL family protein N-acetyltransferase
MIETVYAQNPALLAWVGQRINTRFDPALAQTITAWDVRAGAPAAVVVYSNWQVHRCELSIAADSQRWCSRPFIRACFEYPFLRNSLDFVYGMVEADNERALDFERRLGFVEEARVRGWFARGTTRVDGVMMVMRRESCRWLTMH